MKIYSAHLRPGCQPVLVREGFAWGALFFGPLWLARHGAWIAAGFAVAALVLACTVPAAGLRPLAAFGVLLLLGMLGQDLRRGSLTLGRFALAEIVAARSRDEAWLRLLSARPDLRRSDLRRRGPGGRA